jgi:hypothetical protein
MDTLLPDKSKVLLGIYFILLLSIAKFSAPLAKETLPLPLTVPTNVFILEST